jgi:ribosomal protein S18 acetylase RimI-like enzyme
VTDQVQLEQRDAQDVWSIWDEIRSLYAEVRADRAGDPFYSVERFDVNFPRQCAHDGFEFIGARVDGRLIGLIYGFSELGGAQFGVCELMVSEGYRRRGIARRLHDELLTRRPEPKALLYVRKDNIPALSAYTKWGWHKIGDAQPTPDAPNFDEMQIDLPLADKPRNV